MYTIIIVIYLSLSIFYFRFSESSDPTALSGSRHGVVLLELLGTGIVCYQKITFLEVSFTEISGQRLPKCAIGGTYTRNRNLIELTSKSHC